ncbi:MAG: peptidoglycan DD-metalloendopeptidase family protein [Microcella sp.]|nr:peptidoglycan DD-metalloendopeptidase family protein [Microcella sp.]
MTTAMPATTGDAAARPRSRRASAFTAAITALALLVTGSIAVTEQPAYAADYPSWNDVLEARRDVAAAQAKIREIRAAISAITAEVERTQAVAEEMGTLYYEAQLAFDEAAYNADQLQIQADDAQARADESRLRAGQFVAELARSGGGDLSAALFADPGQADSLLSRLGFASKITEQADGIYAAALQDQNAAQSLTDQAVVAKQLRDELRIEAEAAYEAAQAAALAAQEALLAQQENQARLEAQLAVLVENRAATEKDYSAGVAARAAEVARLNAEKIANGWAIPVSGWISSHWGYRVHPVLGYVAFHSGTDIAAGCGRPIYAASSGTVEYAGWNGSFGYFVRVNHGGGLTTSYSHIQQGGILVQMGQSVSVGQNIARVGTTGRSNGCHLHFEVREGGVSVNPVPYLRNKGLSIG